MNNSGSYYEGEFKHGSFHGKVSIGSCATFAHDRLPTIASMIIMTIHRM